MGDHRMMSKSIILTDNFLDMPTSTQNLYFYFLLSGDDDGFIKNPKRLMRMIGASDDDMKLLIAKSYIIPFESGVIVIKHWRVHNYIRKDRYHASSCDEKDLLTLNDKKEYSLELSKKEMLLNESGIPSVNQVVYQVSPTCQPQVKLSKAKLSKDKCSTNLDTRGVWGEAESNEASTDAPKKKKAKRFVKPSLQELEEYISEKGYVISAEDFYAYYEANGWRVGRNPMKSWTAALAMWNSRALKQRGYSQQRAYKSKTEQNIDAVYRVMADFSAEEGGTYEQGRHTKSDKLF